MTKERDYKNTHLESGIFHLEFGRNIKVFYKKIIN